MNSSIDDQASQSTTTDQQSETSSSANPHSPSRSAAPPATIQNQFNLINTAGSHYSNHQQHITHNYQSQPQLQQQERQTETSSISNNSDNNNHAQNQETIAYPHSSGGYRQSQQQQQQQQTHNIRSNAFPLPTPTQTPSKRYYTGVDKLIMAAMLDESAVVAAAAAAATASANSASISNAAGCRYMGPSGRGIGYSRDSVRGIPNTYVHIPAPSNKSELELYRLLDRANLLNYFGTFLNFGGDDVQQLSDADEDEFLEIMSLVGMTQKPLHVRRLQKALIEWREVDNSFKRQLNFATTTSNNYPPPTRDQLISENRKYDQQRNNVPVELAVPLRASTPSHRFSGSNQTTPSNYNHQQQYALPHEIHGAPKRLRLMDNLHTKDTAPPNHFLKPNSDSEPRREKLPDDNRLELDDDLINEDDNESSFHGSTVRSDEEDDGKIIDIVDSPRSPSVDRFEMINDESVKRQTCVSPKSSSLAVHSKYGRYKSALLESSSGNVRSE